MVEIITSLQNGRVKLAHQLQNRARARRKERKIVLEGTRLIQDATEQNFRPLFVLYDPASVDYALIAQLQNFKITPLQVSDEIMQHISDTEHPQGIVGVYSLPQPGLPQPPQRVLILDAIREPGNLGTILRTAAAAGVEIVLLAPNCVDPYNPKVLRAGMGAHFRVPIVEVQWSEVRAYCEDLALYIASGAADTSYTEIDWTHTWGLIIGNEAHGISDKAASLDATQIAIPMAANSESLNAAVATGVILFEAQRQRLLQIK